MLDLRYCVWLVKIFISTNAYTYLHTDFYIVVGAFGRAHINKLFLYFTIKTYTEPKSIPLFPQEL